MNAPRKSLLITAGTLAALSGLAHAQDLSQVARGSIRDTNNDGAGDLLDTGTFAGLIRARTQDEDRAILEYDLSAFAGMTITSARFIGTVNVNNAFDNGPRNFDFLAYNGNGIAEPTDFQIAGTLVGMGSYHPPNDLFFDFDFDATAAIQNLVNNGATHAGLRAQATTNPNFPNILSANTILRIEAVPNTCPADLTGSIDPNDPSFGVPDGIVDANDFFFYLDLFAAGDPAADLTGSINPNDPGYGVPDGTLDANDFFFYLDLFADGCP